MTENELLAKIKIRFGIFNEYQDEILKAYIEDVKAYMISAGVKQEVVDSEISVGCIMRGVADLWNFGSGSVKFSDYFYQRVIQLSMSEIKGEENA